VLSRAATTKPAVAWAGRERTVLLVAFSLMLFVLVALERS
jgi:hypothetical protein